MADQFLRSVSIRFDQDDKRYVQSFTHDQPEQIRTFFDEYGFVVVRDVLTLAECDASIQDLLSLLAPSGFNLHDKSTWHLWPNTGMEKYGNPSYDPFFLPQFLRNRQNPKIYNVFVALFQEDDLLVNHDRGCFFRPTTEISQDVSTKENLHLDVNPWHYLGDGKREIRERKKIDYSKLSHFIQENNMLSQHDGLQLQAGINLADNLEEDGGFICVPGFHRVFSETFGRSNKKPPSDSSSYTFTKKDQAFAFRKRIPMRAGSIVVWDQRMAHGSAPNRSQQFRAAQFLKMLPARLVMNSPARGAARTEAIQDCVWKMMTSRDPFFEVSSLGTRLFGFDRYPSVVPFSVQQNIEREKKKQKFI
eukprot:TRINITY_DN17665_c0_g1_i1.p1 TRINITY_DN17665_c0_g1~~TRINITY_DN17665_c0_g1_i1.p1  ORF type:complete len:381 (+),score=55.37 TRINITY_DN17665_c0_g1_i1:62-1144(+)